MDAATSSTMPAHPASFDGLQLETEAPRARLGAPQLGGDTPRSALIAFLPERGSGQEEEPRFAGSNGLARIIPGSDAIDSGYGREGGGGRDMRTERVGVSGLGFPGEAVLRAFTSTVGASTSMVVQGNCDIPGIPPLPGHTADGFVPAGPTLRRLLATLWVEGRDGVYLDVRRTADRPPFGEAEIADARGLLPGLRLALRAMIDCPASAMQREVFQRLPLGVAMLTSRQRLTFPNQAMLAILARGATLRLDHGFLRAGDPADERLLRIAASRVIHGRLVNSELLSLGASSGRPLMAVIERIGSEMAGGGVVDGAKLLVLDPDHAPGEAVTWIGERYRLTPAELAVVRLILHGFDTAECAEQLDLSQGTVRWHFKRIFAKTGVDGRAELILLFMRGLQLRGA